MKRLFLAAAASACLAANAEFVTPEMAAETAEAWIASDANVFGNTSPVSKVHERKIGGRTAYYVVTRKNGDAIVISAETGLEPVMAVSVGVADADGNISLPQNHPLWEMLSTDSTNSLAIVDSVRKPRLRAARQAAPDAEAEKKRKAVEDCDRKWRDLRKKTGQAKGRRKLLGASAPIPSGIVELPGFENWGTLTHWNQTVARRLRGNYEKVFSGTKPLYNYYMHSASTGGHPTGGLQIAEEDPTKWPCGCVATALAAAAQYHRIAGIVQNPTFVNNRYNTVGSATSSPGYDTYLVTTNDLSIGTRHLVTGAYNWDCLPSNFGGSAPEAWSEEELSDEARELIGRVTYNYGLAVGMGYTPDSSGATMFSDQTPGCTQFIESQIDKAHMFLPDDYEMLSDGTRWYPQYSRDPADHIDSISAAIYLGEPVSVSVYSYGVGGHAILAVGAAPGMVKFFMGWGGVGDTWYNASQSSIGGLFTLMTSAKLLGGVNCPVIMAQISSVMARTRTVDVKVSPVFSASSSTSGSSVSMVTNGNRMVAAVSVPTATFARNREYTVNYTVSVSAPQFEYAGVTYSPVTRTFVESRRWMSSYPGGEEFVNGYRCEHAYSHLLNYGPYYNPYGIVTLSTDYTYYGDSFAYGTPQSISLARDAAYSENVPLVVISGHDSDQSAIVSSFRSSIDQSGRTKGCVPYYLNVDHDVAGMEDWDNSYAVFDPWDATFPVDSVYMWDADCASRLSYGTFSDATDMDSAVSGGVSAFGGLDPDRPDYKENPWYRKPSHDTNAATVASATFNMASYVGQGKTSVHAGQTVSSVTRSDYGYGIDRTILYLDLGQSSIQSLPNYAFENLRALVSCEGLPSGVTSLPAYCFAECESLNDLSGLGQQVTSAGNFAFAYCPLLKNTDGMSKFSSIGQGLFYGPSSGAFSITEWPSSVTSVPESTFRGKSGLSSLSGLPDTVTSYGITSFAETGVTSLSGTGTNVASFGHACFLGSGLTSAVIPKKVSSIGTACFEDCPNLASVDLSGPGIGNVTIGDNAFAAGRTVNVTTGTNRSSVGTSYMNWGLRSGSHVVFTDGTVTIQSDPLDTNPGRISTSSVDMYTVRTSSWTSVKIGFGTSTVTASKLTGNNTTMRTADLSSSTATSLPDRMFYNFKALERAMIPFQITSLPDSCFYGCTAMKDSSFVSERITSYGERIFQSSGVTNAVVKPSVTSMGELCFAICSSLTNISGMSSYSGTLPYGFFYDSPIASTRGIENVTGMSNNVFEAYSSSCKQAPLSIDVWPSAVDNVPENTFYYRQALTSLGALETSGVKSFGQQAFAYTGLSGTVVIPSSVTNISAACFSVCNGISKIVMPSSLEKLGANVFYSCTGLQEVDMTGVSNFSTNIFSVGNKSFWNVWTTFDVKVPVTVSSATSSDLANVMGLGSGCRLVCTDGTITVP